MTYIENEVLDIDFIFDLVLEDEVVEVIEEEVLDNEDEVLGINFDIEVLVLDI